MVGYPKKGRHSGTIEHFREAVSEKSVPIRNNKFGKRIKADSFANRETQRQKHKHEEVPIKRQLKPPNVYRGKQIGKF